jgi:tetrahydromethanopterin S-methyltransferase subunit D
MNVTASTHLVDWLRGLIAPLLLGGIGIGAIFFLFQREVMRFAQFILLAILCTGIFYTPGIIPWIAKGITGALGVH